MTTDPFDLERFVSAQGTTVTGTYTEALAELRRGRKTSHWMWFVFPQIAGLGQSPISRRYAITSLDEARAYLQHPILGPRLVECAGVVADLPNTSAVAIFGSVDAQKLHSSMTLFATADPDQPIFRRVLDTYFGGRDDAATQQRV